jgi:uncharacterized damage-inducible protein DinB
MENPACSALKQILTESVTAIISELETLQNKDLLKIVDTGTKDPNTKSIQTILTHIVYAGNMYLYDISVHSNIPCPLPDKLLFTTTDEYRWALDNLVNNIEILFTNLTDEMLEEFDESKKILTPWNQKYDIEQLLEHAIVHNYRHLRQIRNFRKKFSF